VSGRDGRACVGLATAGESLKIAMCVQIINFSGGQTIPARSRAGQTFGEKLLRTLAGEVDVRPAVPFGLHPLGFIDQRFAIRGAAAAADDEVVQLEDEVGARLANLPPRPQAEHEDNEEDFHVQAHPLTNAPLEEARHQRVVEFVSGGVA
jgi:hypothetical protein